MGNFYWLKLKKDFYKRHDMIILESMDCGKEIELIYIKMLCESIDHCGELRYNDKIAYTPKLLAPIFNTTEEMVKNAISVLEDLELIEIREDGTIQMTKMGSFIGYETDMAEKKRIQRNLPTLKNGSKRLNGTCLVTPDMKKHTVDEKRYGGHGMEAIDRAFGKCEICGSDKNVCIHHNNGYSNELDDLVCLCRDCHSKAHNKKNGGHIDIMRPPYVHQMSTKCPPNVHPLSGKRPQNVCPDIDIEKDIDIENRERKEIRKIENYRSLSGRPNFSEIELFVKEKGLAVDPQAFFDYYEKRDWQSNGETIKNWQALCISWNGSEIKPKKTKKKEDLPILENTYDQETLENMVGNPLEDLQKAILKK